MSASISHRLRKRDAMHSSLSCSLFSRWRQKRPIESGKVFSPHISCTTSFCSSLRKSADISCNRPRLEYSSCAFTQLRSISLKSDNIISPQNMNLSKSLAWYVPPRSAMVSLYASYSSNRHSVSDASATSAMRATKAPIVIKRGMKDVPMMRC